jgi:hypothetical protein
MKKHLITISWVFLTVILVGCNQGNQASSPGIQITASPAQPLPTDFITSQASLEPGSLPIPTNTLAATVQPIPTFTPMVTQTALPMVTILPTWTLKPTLPSKQAQEYALEMVRTNGGCKLPCWLGITPGKTTWGEAYGILAPFAKDIDPQEPEPGNISHVPFSFPDSTERGAYLTYNKAGVVFQIETPENIPLPELLTTYGPPSEIRIHAIGVYTMDPVGRFTLVLFYQNQGIMAVYDGENEKSNFIHICPSYIHEPQFAWLLWSPTEKLTFSDAGKMTLFPHSPEEEEKYISLEKLTGMDVQTFYAQYKDPANQGKCMYIQAPDWP